MARRQRDLDPGGGPVVEFARELRVLREAVGDPKFASMARRSGRSKTALAEAAGGRRLPRWETVEGFVRACDGDPVAWRARWLAVRGRVDDQVAATLVADVDPAGSSADGASADGCDPIDDRPGGEVVTHGSVVAPDALVPRDSTLPVHATDPPSAVEAPRAAWSGPARGRTRRGVTAGAVVVAAAVAVLGAFVLGRVTAGPEPWEVPLLRVIEVQNKVALGRDRLDEDRTPAYLSTLALAYCAAPDRGCKVPGTELGSGAALVAHCVVRGQQMWNYDLRDPDVGANPDRAGSALWYRASFPDGRVGYVSEVYLTASSRGGLGLPDCSSGVSGQ